MQISEQAEKGIRQLLEKENPRGRYLRILIEGFG